MARYRRASISAGHTSQVSRSSAAAAPAASSPSAPGRALAALCCAPLFREPLTASQAEDLSRVMKALADPTRLRLVSMVAAHDGGEACVCDLTVPLGLTQPTISHYLKILVDAGILARYKRGSGPSTRSCPARWMPWHRCCRPDGGCRACLDGARRGGPGSRRE